MSKDFSKLTSEEISLLKGYDKRAFRKWALGEKDKLKKQLKQNKLEKAKLEAEVAEAPSDSPAPQKRSRSKKPKKDDHPVDAE